MNEPIYRLPPVDRGPVSFVIPATGEVNWGMAAFNVDALRTAAGSATVKAGIIDTGVDAAHPLLQNLVKARDFTGSASGSDDRNGHGTHCSGTVAGMDSRIGVNTGEPFYHGKGLGDSGTGGNSLIDAMEWALSEGCELLSCSWGGGGQSLEWERQFRDWVESPARPWLIFAGGNSGPNTPDTDWPGRSMNLINVAALQSDLSPASFSSAGEKIDTSGPGVGIWSCRAGGGFQQMSGTSMATPFVCGLLTLYRRALKSRGLYIPTTPELRQLLFGRSTDTHTPGDDRRTGPGWITPLLLALNLTPDPAPLG